VDPSLRRARQFDVAPAVHVRRRQNRGPI
jgi:hypothetical protein